MNEYKAHKSVQLDDCLKYIEENFGTEKPIKILDLTFGAGGHSFAFLEKFKNSEVTATDQDPDALKNGYAKIEASLFKNRIQLLKMNFSNYKSWHDENCPEKKYDVILADLGVSSHHFDEAGRGFSYRFEGPLDMRMASDSSQPTAADLVNSMDEEGLADLFFKYGEERYSRRIAKKIIEVREQNLIETTKQLEDIIFHCYPAKDRHAKTHPATRCFQALRIAVNDELGVIENTIPKLLPILAIDGVLMIISFHSLEDRIVKHSFKDLVETSEIPVKIITKKPIIPSVEEIGRNARARSAKLRILKRSLIMEDKYGNKKQKKFFSIPE
jgi:16S rRNA (cytosine1402-N4)-methyltransferase